MASMYHQSNIPIQKFPIPAVKKMALAGIKKI